jgi:hypothetical protein
MSSPFPPPVARSEPASVLPQEQSAAAGARQFGWKFAHGVPAARARAAVRRMLDAWGLSQHADDVLLVTTELIENVAQHTDDGCELRLAVLPDAILVEVSDADPRLPVMRAHDPRRLGGRGLIIVAAIARRWGFEPTSRDGHVGKVVWAELAL